MVERCALSGSDLKIKFRTILLISNDSRKRGRGGQRIWPPPSSYATTTYFTRACGLGRTSPYTWYGTSFTSSMHTGGGHRMK